jgi:hypothetical protein
LIGIDVCAQLYEMALKHEAETAVVSSGALAASSGEKTGVKALSRCQKKPFPIAARQ